MFKLIKNNLLHILIIILSFVSVMVITQLYWAYNHNYNDIVLRIILAIIAGFIMGIIYMMIIKYISEKFESDYGDVLKRFSIVHLPFYLLWLYVLHIKTASFSLNIFLPIIVLVGVLILFIFLFKDKFFNKESFLTFKDNINKDFDIIITKTKSINKSLISNNQKIKNTIFIIVILLIILLGFYFRIDGYFLKVPSFGVDEVQIARYLSWENGLQKTIEVFGSSRPLGYLILNKIIIDIYSIEETIRLTSLLPSLASLFIIFLLSKKIFKTKWTIIITVTLFAFNPFLISFAKVFKHYSMEIFTHMFLIYLLIRYLDNNKLSNFITLCISLYFSVFFCGANVIFLYPGVYLLLLHRLLKDRRYKRLTVTLIVAFLTIITLLLIYLFIWRNSLGRFITKWESSYGGFVNDGTNYIGWLFVKIKDLLIYFFNYPSDELSQGIGFIFIPFLLLGFIFIIRNYKLFFVIIIPIITMILFNLMNYWPLGTDRTNLFIIFYFIIICGVGFDFIIQNKNRATKFIVALVFFITLVVFISPSKLNYYELPLKKYNTPYENIKSPLKYLYENHDESNNKKKKLYLNTHGWIGFEYYVYYHDILSTKYKPFFEKNFEVIVYDSRNDEYVRNTTKKILKNSKKDLWFLFYHYGRESQAFFETFDKYSIYDAIKYEGSSIIKVLSETSIKEIYTGKEYEVENGTFIGLTEEGKIRSDIPNTSGSYVVNTNVYFKLVVKEKGTYKLRAKTIAKDGGSDSWFIAIDDEERKRWNVPHSQEWKWNTAPFKWKLDTGEYILKLEHREPTPLDRIEIIRTDIP